MKGLKLKITTWEQRQKSLDAFFVCPKIIILHDYNIEMTDV